MVYVLTHTLPESIPVQPIEKGVVISLPAFFADKDAAMAQGKFFASRSGVASGTSESIYVVPANTVMAKRGSTTAKSSKSNSPK